MNHELKVLGDLSRELVLMESLLISCCRPRWAPLGPAASDGVQAVPAPPGPGPARPRAGPVRDTAQHRRFNKRKAEIYQCLGLPDTWPPQSRGEEGQRHSPEECRHIG